MPAIPTLRVAQLLSARLCHDLAGPISAVANGVELLGQDLDPAADAVALVETSARRLTARLLFYRFAYGHSGEGETAGPPPCELAERYFAATNIACRYGESVRKLGLAEQQLGCNLLLLGAEALGRGGSIALDAAASILTLEAAGEAVGLAPERIAAMTPEMPAATLSARTAQAYFAGLLAAALGRRLVVRPAGRAGLSIAAIAPRA